MSGAPGHRPPGGAPGVEVVEVPVDRLATLAAIPIRFEVRSVLHAEPRDAGLGGIVLTERPVERPYAKDYDALAGEGPARWAQRFDVSAWGVLEARRGQDRVGSAVIAWRSPGVLLLDGRSDLAALWDLRVVPASRGHGVGHALFRAAEAWAQRRGCRQLKVETQNTNVPACRFYVRQGCSLGGINRHAYPALPAEVQLLWYRELGALLARDP